MFQLFMHLCRDRWIISGKSNYAPGMIESFDDQWPEIHDSAYVAASADLIGQLQGDSPPLGIVEQRFYFIGAQFEPILGGKQGGNLACIESEI